MSDRIVPLSRTIRRIVLAFCNASFPKGGSEPVKNVETARSGSYWVRVIVAFGYRLTGALRLSLSEYTMSVTALKIAS